jgi:iron complex transport system permease protein
MSTARRRVPAAWLLGGLAVALCVVVTIAAGRGAYAIDSRTVLAVLLDHAGIAGGDFTAQQASVLWAIRLPRVLLGVCVGAGLGIAGAVMQSLFRNPLADPGLVGVSSGAALAVAVIIVFGGALGPWAVRAGPALLPPAACIGAWFASWLVYRIGRTTSGVSVAAMLLAGIAINALAIALIGLASYLANDEQLRNLTFWSLGTLNQARWPATGAVAVATVAALLVLWPLRTGLNALALGEAEAAYLGVPVERLKRFAVFGTAIAVGASVAFCGMIGFIGLVAPHCVRMLGGPDARVVLPGAALLGAVLISIADVMARTVAAPAEIPIGVLTALLGTPFFLVLLLSNRHRMVVS